MKDEAQLDGHPVHTYRKENGELEQRPAEIDDVFKKRKKAFEKGTAAKKGAPSRKTILPKVNDLFIFEKHYQRKENQLFSKLKEKGFTGPTSAAFPLSMQTVPIAGLSKYLKTLQIYKP